MLSVVVEQLLLRGHTASLVRLLRSVEFEWDASMRREIANFAESLAVLLRGSGWRMEARGAELVSGPTSDARVSEADLEWGCERRAK